MAFRGAFGVVLLLATGACESALTGPETIAGEYALARVDGAPLPCCAQSDSGGTVVTIVAGRLTLGDAAPQEYIYTPGAGPLARACGHEIPNGALVDRSGKVTLPDGRTYHLPPCGDGDYALEITRQYRHPDGTRDTISETTAGKYTWGTEPSGAWIVTLVTSRGLGHLTRTGSGVDLTIDWRAGG